MRETPKGSKYWVPDVKNKPVKGMTFDTLDHVHEFYKRYAIECGFQVKKSSENTNKGVITRKYYRCSRDGFKVKKKIDSLDIKDKKQRRLRPSFRCGCEALIIVKLNSNKVYEIDEFNESHNHSLVHKEDAHFLTSQRQLTYDQKNALLDLGNINMGPNKGFKVLKQARGGYEKVGATVVDCKNFKRDFNSLIGDKDADMVIEQMLKKQQHYPDFSFEYCQETDDSLGCLFWADEKAKRNYIAFGDKHVIIL